jgi:hypothetical protein
MCHCDVRRLSQSVKFKYSTPEWLCHRLQLLKLASQLTSLVKVLAPFGASWIDEHHPIYFKSTLDGYYTACGFLHYADQIKPS